MKVKEFNYADSAKSSSDLDLSFLKNFLHSKALLGIAFLLIAAAGLLAVERYLSSTRVLKIEQKLMSPVSLKQMQESSESTQSIDLPIVLKSESFDLKNFNNYIPADSDIYIYGTNLGQLLENIPNDNIYTDLFNRAPQVLEQDFVVFTIKIDGATQWGLVTKNSTTALESLDTSTVYDNTGDYLLVGSVDAVLDLILDAYKGNARSILQSPEYVKALNLVPQEGGAMILFLSPYAKEEITIAKEYLRGTTLENVIDAILKTGYNEIVIL